MSIRETILFAGTLGLNGFLQMGYNGDWASHNIRTCGFSGL